MSKSTPITFRCDLINYTTTNDDGITHYSIWGDDYEFGVNEDNIRTALFWDSFWRPAIYNSITRKQSDMLELSVRGDLVESLLHDCTLGLNHPNYKVLPSIIDDDCIELIDPCVYYACKDSNQLLRNRYFYHTRYNVVLSCSAFTLNDEFMSIQRISYHPFSSNVHTLLSELLERIDKQKYEPNETIGNFHILTSNGGGGLRTARMEFTVPKVDIDVHYNNDFQPVHSRVVDSLTNGDNGIILLHGISGSGKTSYIRHLTKIIKDRKFIYIPINMIHSLSEPNMINFLSQSGDIVFIIEDCEGYIRKRTDGDINGTISSLLSLGDGLLSDVVGCQFILTFNTDISSIDDALLREGRLITSYEFGKLCPEKTTKLLGEESGEKTLAEIFAILNKNKPTIAKKERKMSFGFNQTIYEDYY